MEWERETQNEGEIEQTSIQSNLQVLTGIIYGVGTIKGWATGFVVPRGVYMYTGERDERTDYTLYSNFHLHCVAKLQCLKGCFGMCASMELKGLLRTCKRDSYSRAKHYYNRRRGFEMPKETMVKREKEKDKQLHV